MSSQRHVSRLTYRHSKLAWKWRGAPQKTTILYLGPSFKASSFILREATNKDFFWYGIVADIFM